MYLLLDSSEGPHLGIVECLLNLDLGSLDRDSLNLILSLLLFSIILSSSIVCMYPFTRGEGLC